MVIWWLIETTLTVAVLAAVVAAGCRVLRCSPAVRHALWLVVLLKLLLPPVVPCPWSPSQYLGEALAAATAGPHTTPPGSDAFRTHSPFVPTASVPATWRRDVGGREERPERLDQREPAAASEVTGPDRPAATSDSVATSQRPATSLDSATSPDSATSRSPIAAWWAATNSTWRRAFHDGYVVWAVVGLWVTAGLAVAWRQSLAIWRLSRLSRRSQPVPPRLEEQVAAVAALLRVQPPRIVVVDNIRTPFVWCLTRPLLYWPSALVERADTRGAQQRSQSIRRWQGVIAHELAHLGRRDHWVAWVELVAGWLWWWNPAFRYVRSQLRESAELACDAWVVAALPRSRRAYAEALVEVSELVSKSAPLVPVLGVSTGAGRSFQRRLTMVLRERVPSKVSWRGLLGVGLLALVALPSWLIAQSPSGKPPAAAADKPAAAPPTEGPAAVKAVATPADAKTPPAKAPLAKTPPAKPAAARTLRVVVLDPQGKPLEGADVKAGIWTHQKNYKSTRDYKTDAAGAALVELPKTYYIVRIWARKKPLVGMYAGWEQDELASGGDLPADYVFRLETPSTVGGRIVDEQGKPIAGAKVQVKIANRLDPAKGDGRTRYDGWLAEAEDAATTDADGRWQIDNAPNRADAELGLLVTHPDYLSDDNWQGLQRAAGITSDMLRKRIATLTLKQGITVIGWVTDPEGKPVKDAVIVLGDRPLFWPTRREFLTDAEGRFRLPPQAPHETSLTVIARGWAPQLRRINLQAGLPSQDFRLQPGKTIRLQVVDAAGKPVPDAQVSIGAWRRLEALHNIAHPNVRDNGIPRRTNADGVWEWTWAPDDLVKLNVYADGVAPVELEIAGGAAPRTVTLKAEHRVTGRVIDAVTGKPVPAFTVIPMDVFRKDWLHAERDKAEQGKNGLLSFLATRTDIPQRLRVEAPGYRTQDGPEFRVGDDAARVQDFRLQPSKRVAGVVVDAEGRPVGKAEVLLATPTQEARLSQDYGNHKSFTDAAGRFTFPDPAEHCAVIARTDTGFARAELAAGALDAGTLRLQRWASIRGQFRDGGRAVRSAWIFAEPIGIRGLTRPKVDDDFQVRTGADGRFEFPRVPPGPTSVRVHIGPWKDEGFRSGPNVPLDLKPGERVELDLGGGGVTVTGKVKLTAKNGKLPDGLDCTYSINYLVRREPGIAPPPEIARLGFDIRDGWRDVWQSTAEGLAYTRTLRHWFVKLAPDGSFQISGVPAGEYELVVAVYANPQGGCLVDPLARQRVRVKVTDADAARGELALNEIAAEVVPITAVGDTPALTFKRSDGSDGSLADYRGKHTVVHFWASWCGPCKQQLPALRRVQERFAARGLTTVGLSLDDEPEAWQAALKRLDLPWPQGRLGAASDAGVSSVPAYWLLDPSGKIVAKVYDPDELTAALAGRLK